jgi:hypothetical protein
VERSGRFTSTRKLSVALRGFSREAVESEAARLRVSPAEFLQAAVDRHLTRQAGRHASRGLPPLKLEPPGGEPLELEVELAPDALGVLEIQAAVEEVSTAALVEHAALTLVAELDSASPAAARIAAELG